jgi:WD40 repeat protein
VRISDAPFGQTATREVRTDSPIETAGFNSDGSLVYVVERIHAPDGSIKQQIQLRNCSSGQPAAPVLTETNAFGDLAVNNAGTKCLIWSTNGVQLVDIPSGTRSGLGFIPRGEAATCFFALSNRIFVVAAGKTVRICDAETGEPISAPLAHDYPVRWAVLSPDESRVLTGCADPYLTKCYAQFWNAQTGTAIGDRLRHGDGVLAGAFSSDGKKVVTAAEDFTAIVWDAQTGKQLTSLLEHADQVAKAAFVPDGRRVATASFDRTSRVWDAQTGAPLTPYLPHISGLRDVGFVGGNLITSDRPARGGEGHSWLWVLQADNRPVEDLSKVARLLTAGVVSPAAPHRRFASESFQADWDFLRSKYMAGFSVTTNEVLAWHEYQAQTAETRSNWFTAVFHLERLVRLESAGANLLHRREVANSRLNEGTSSEGSE